MHKQEFRNRRNSYAIDDDDPDYNWNDKGVKTDYFTYDFTLEELLTLRRKQVWVGMKVCTGFSKGRLFL